MGMLDKLVSAVTPEPSAEEKAKVHAEARARSGGSGWLSLVLDHHEAVDLAFATVREVTTADARKAAVKELATILTGHSIAEEAVLYPAMALHDQKTHSGEAYTEQSAAKVQAAALQDLDPLSKDFLDKLEHLRAAVTHHVYEEESEWFPKLRDTGDAAFQATLSRRYKEQFDRYMGNAA